ncbi:MAG: SDR family oxidoreductase [Balneolaceae bacterium]
MKEISIIGCGWLGLPLARRLIEIGYSVYGSTTSDHKIRLLEDSGIKARLLRVSARIEGDDCDDLFRPKILFVNIPPGRREPDVLQRHPKQIQAIRKAAEEGEVEWVIFASSTSVYSPFGGLTLEDQASGDNASSDSGRALLQAERLLLESPRFNTTIIRFGGLYGYDRQPVRHLAGRDHLKGGNKPVNLIHQDDAVRVVEEILRLNICGEIFNAVADGHPTREEYYRSVARRFGLDEPAFLEDTEKNYRVVSNKKLKEKTGFTFLHPTPIDQE